MKIGNFYIGASINKNYIDIQIGNLWVFWSFASTWRNLWWLKDEDDRTRDIIIWNWDKGFNRKIKQTIARGYLIFMGISFVLFFLGMVILALIELPTFYAFLMLFAWLMGLFTWWAIENV